MPRFSLRISKLKKLWFIEKTSSIIKRELQANTKPLKASLSLAIGVCVAISPFHGLQIIMVLIIAFTMRLNRPLALLGLSISSAPLLPFWLVAGIEAGDICLSDSQTLAIVNVMQHYIPQSAFQWLQDKIGHGIVSGIVYFFVGSMVLSIIGGVVTFAISYYFFSIFEKKKSKQ